MQEWFEDGPGFAEAAGFAEKGGCGAGGIERIGLDSQPLFEPFVGCCPAPAAERQLSQKCSQFLTLLTIRRLFKGTP